MIYYEVIDSITNEVLIPSGKSSEIAMALNIKNREVARRSKIDRPMKGNILIVNCNIEDEEIVPKDDKLWKDFEYWTNVLRESGLYNKNKIVPDNPESDWEELRERKGYYCG